MPFWFCHYFRLETGTSFAIYTIDFSFTDSYLLLALFSLAILFSVLSISIFRLRFASVVLAGILHLIITAIHIARLIHPFRFEVFNIEMPMSGSKRELLFGIPLVIACIAVAISLKRKTSASRDN
jgi:hypothetical protein